MIVGADPEGSILSGDSPRSYKVQGIGEDFSPKTFNRQVVDEMVRVSDKESFHTARRLAREGGLLVGESAGTAVAAALKFANTPARPHYMVVRLPNMGRNYISKIYIDQWMQENGFWENRAEPQMTAFGGMISFELNGGFAAVERFAEMVRLFVLGESLGGVGSLVCYPPRMTHASFNCEERERRGIRHSLVRLSVDIEHVNDLWSDLAKALSV